MSPSGPPTDPAIDPDVLLARAGWGEIQDRIVRGLCHDLNGRVASLQAALHLAAAGEPLPDGAEHEVARLDELSRRLPDLVGDVGADPGPASLRDLLQRALVIHESVRHGSTSSPETDVEGELPAVLVNRGRCLRALVVFLDLARPRDEEGFPRLRLRGDANGVQLSCAVGTGGLGDAFEALRALVELDGGDLRVGGGELMLQLPSLKVARAAGR